MCCLSAVFKNSLFSSYGEIEFKPQLCQLDRQFLILLS